MFYGSFVPFAPFSLTKMQEVRTDGNAQKIIQQFYTNGNGSRLTQKEIQQKKTRLEKAFEETRERQNETFTVIASDVNETTATVIVAEYNSVAKDPNLKGWGYEREGYILKLIKYPKGWVMKGIYAEQDFTIQGIGKCQSFGMRSDGTIAKVLPKTHKMGISIADYVDISDKHMTVYDLLEQVK